MHVSVASFNRLGRLPSLDAARGEMRGDEEIAYYTKINFIRESVGKW